MAVEVLSRRGYEDQVGSWLDRYVARLETLPGEDDPITEDNWAEAMGQRRRVGDWVAFFRRAVREAAWPEVLAAWWPRLLPAIASRGDARPDQDRARGPDGSRRRHLAERGRRDRPRAGVLGGPRDLRARAGRPGRRSRCRGGAGRAAPAARADAGRSGSGSRGSVTCAAWTPALTTLRAAGDRRGAGRAGQPGRGRCPAVRHARPRQPGPARPRRHGTERDAPVLPALPADLWPSSFAATWAACAAITVAYAPAQPRPAQPDAASRSSSPMISWRAPPSTATSTSSS